MSSSKPTTPACLDTPPRRLPTAYGQQSGAPELFDSDLTFQAYLRRDCVLSDRFVEWEGHAALPNQTLSARAALFAAEHSHLLQGRSVSWLVREYESREQEARH